MNCTTLPEMGSAALTKADYETLAAFRYALRAFLRFSEEAAQAAGLSPQQHQALLAMEGTPDRDEVTIGELAERLQVRHHSAVGLVDRLEQERLVARRIAPEDRRKVLVHVTARGLHRLESLSAAHREELRRVGPVLQEILARLTSA